MVLQLGEDPLAWDPDPRVAAVSANRRHSRCTGRIVADGELLQRARPPTPSVGDSIDV